LLEDENRRRAFGEAGYRRVVEHFGIEQTVQEIEAIYREVLAKHGRPANN